MKRVLLSLVIGIFFLTLQATLLPSLPIQKIRPDIVLILVLYWGLSASLISGGILSFSMGFLMDLFSANSLGLYAFSRTLLFFLAQLFKDRFYLERALSQFLFVFLFALFEGFLILALLSAMNPSPLGNLTSLFFSFFFPQSFLTGLISPPLFLLLNKVNPLSFQQNGMGFREQG
jgi:rod shape-determining protein MreD